VGHERGKIIPLLLGLAVYLTYLGTVEAQAVWSTEHNSVQAANRPIASCETIRALSPVKEALKLACLRTNGTGEGVPIRNAMIIGFVGGFVKHDDLNHPEVTFAALLSELYPSIHAEVFSNHAGKKAFRQVLAFLDTNHDGIITAREKEQADIVIYGHSWGASQAVALARALGRHGIPVLLSIQIDSVRKLGQDDSTIPANVKNAINFYETEGLIHGRSMIRAAAPDSTNILGNFQMDYRTRPINCDNYPWLARHLNKAHYEIENDPLVWNKIRMLIDIALLRPTTVVSATLPPEQLSLR
jgi:hypothetical protein